MFLILVAGNYKRTIFTCNIRLCARDINKYSQCQSRHSSTVCLSSMSDMFQPGQGRLQGVMLQNVVRKTLSDYVNVTYNRTVVQENLHSTCLIFIKPEIFISLQICWHVCYSARQTDTAQQSRQNTPTRTRTAM